MRKIFSVTFVILFTAALAFSLENGQTQTPSPANPGCIVKPEVIEDCTNSGGRFDFKLCSCVHSAQNPIPVGN